MVKKLANQRRCVDTFRDDQWDILLSSKEPANQITNKLSNLKWKKKQGEKLIIQKLFKNCFLKLKIYHV